MLQFNKEALKADVHVEPALARVNPAPAGFQEQVITGRSVQFAAAWPARMSSHLHAGGRIGIPRHACGRVW